MSGFGRINIVRRSLRQHALSSIITAISVALASGLTMAVFAINHQSYDAFTAGEIGFDAVLGARGSQLQLVLNTVFHLETSPGNIPWSSYREMAANPQVELAVPYAVGDNYQGYRVVGTIPELFTGLRYSSGEGFAIEEGGRVFAADQREVVVGGYVARRLGLRIGDTIQPSHGLRSGDEPPHEDEYTVVGILEPTNTPSDRVLWIPIEGFYRMSGHVLRGAGTVFEAVEGEVIPEDQREVSAVMLKFASPQVGFLLNGQINMQGRTETLAWPIGRVMADLFDRIGWVSRVLGLVSYLVVVVAPGSILASIYNTMNERRREFAILRALGARRSTVFATIVLESTTITMFGLVLGYVVYGAIMAATIMIVRQTTGVVLEAFTPDLALLLVPLAMILLGAAAGVVPAVKAYRTDVASNLVPLT